ncbi:CHAT domain-containing protein [Streptomyces sp. NBC_00201]|uniref:CHAT domain-containing protein n=1 Tax=unclassified Streptomyces TaxID=2593676 RepID=UPI00224D605C|nr:MULTISPECIES: CHAT domain-containing protein [unclassified Streptomyces]MCX5061527.1 CHAT domain-containing protein [Streptomyces sp. NBC_00452]MCX5249073.1 CHAT domain-containing protein [Streptomyces sp. NBC_00201]MCX5292859.1 CHAT domain-containing protein [Streptomyces sp. NBC_00183]
MEEFTAARLQRDGVVKVLAELYPGVAETRLLVEPLGGDLARVPDQAVPLVRWYALCRLTEHGAFPFTLEGLLRAALAEYPGARALRELLDDRLSGLPDPARVLFLMSGPRTEQRLALGVEFDGVQDAVRVPGSRRIDLRVRAAARNDDVVSALDDGRPDVVHFAGHGSADGFLLMEAPDGATAPVRTDWLAQALTAIGGVHCLVLAGCHLGGDLRDFTSCADFSIGSRHPLLDEDAASFSRGFYEGLRRGRDVPAAFALGAAQVTMTAGDARGLVLARRAAV